MMEENKVVPLKKRTGPATAKGKSNSSQNSLKHGLFAKKMPILSEEDTDFLEDLLQNLVAEYAPTTPTEILLVQEIAVGWFRLNKIWDAEAAAVNKARLEAELAHSFPTTSDRADSYLEKMGRSKQEKAEFDLLQKGISYSAKVAAGVLATDSYARYERHISRQLHGAVDRLKTIQLSRQS